MTYRQRAARQRFNALVEEADHLFGRLRTVLDDAGQQADLAASTCDGTGDMLGCFASNTLEGSRALLREMVALVAKAARKPRPEKTAGGKRR